MDGKCRDYRKQMWYGTIFNSSPNSTLPIKAGFQSPVKNCR